MGGELGLLLVRAGVWPMGLIKSTFVVRAFIAVAVVSVAVVQSTGCYTTATQSAKRWASRPAMEEVEVSGLEEAEQLDALKVMVAAPEKWGGLPLRKNALYSHKQWRSPSLHTGVGVVYIKLPVPLPMGTLLWLAKQEYTKKEDDGRLIGQWKDSIGRSWFEAENNKYHVKGYITMNGLDAWVVYSGYRTTTEREPEQVALAERAMQAIRPMMGTAGQAQASAQ